MSHTSQIMLLVKKCLTWNHWNGAFKSGLILCRRIVGGFCNISSSEMLQLVSLSIWHGHHFTSSTNIAAQAISLKFPVCCSVNIELTSHRYATTPSSFRLELLLFTEPRGVGHVLLGMNYGHFPSFILLLFLLSVLQSLFVFILASHIFWRVFPIWDWNEKWSKNFEEYLQIASVQLENHKTRTISPILCGFSMRFETVCKLMLPKKSLWSKWPIGGWNFSSNIFTKEIINWLTELIIYLQLYC